MARFFIDRPIFAWVVAIVIMLAGVISILSLPIAQYPSIAPPSISISGSYPGASAKTVEDAVTQVIEQKMKGIDGLRYMASSSDATGGISITLTFTSGTNPDIAQVQVQNKLQLATPLLPTAVTQQGLVVSKATKNFLMVFGFISENGKMDQTDLSDYVAANVVDPLSRVPGVGDVTLFGSQYAMRIWLNPAKLQSFNLTPADVITAVQAQNAEVSAGELGGTPSIKGQQLNATVSAQSRLQTVEQFGAILLKTTTNGAMVYLKDVASMELGRENYNTVARYNGHAATGVAIKLATGANALDTANAAKAMLGNLSKQFPEGMSYQVAFDTTPFVKLSIEEVVKTLVEAVILVFLVMYLFLQNFRATLIPTMAVPVVLLGTFGILNAFGYSINTLTMFAMVLAIGLLVDDAIVVVENVERVMSEEGLSPLEATRKSMTQITGALVGIAMVLSAVFVPMAFFGGSTGVIYRQFSITIVSSMVLSVVVALVFTPALCATLLKPVEKGHHATNKGFFGWFNRSFDSSSNKYQGLVGSMIRHRARSMLLYVLLLAGLVFIFMRLPTSFLPEEDQGILFTQIQLPTGATQERTLKVIEQVEDHFMNSEKDNVASVFAVAGFSFGGNGQNTGIAFVRLKDWSLRKDVAQKAPAVAGRAMGKLLQIKDAMVFTFAPPAVLELGNATGFDMQLQDIGGVGHDALMAARNQLLGMASQNPAMVGVRPNGQEDTPQYKIDIDQQKATALGLQISEINRVLSVGWGSSYVNDFLDRGRVKKVFIQGDASSRMLPEDLNKWFVRNTAGQMVPFSAFATGKWIYASPRLERYNGLPSVEILGTPAPGQSTGAAMNAMEEMVAKLPPGIGFSWTGVSLEERESGSQTPQLYALSLLIVFLCLAALYESWSIPFSVLLVVPLGVIGAVLGTWFFGLSNDVYFQVGLLTVVGLSAKNAILIVEFAKEMQESGMSLLDATLHAVRLRLRPILMTSIAFGLGVLPLAISSGAGSGSQNAIGIGVLGGMLTATFLGIFFVPVFFVLVRGFFSKPDAPATPATPGSPAVTLSKDAH
ncbi:MULTISPECIES: efflux RND transporter permease subunit [Janthinobacterium]|uniref:Efflux pump membrane transporter n=1 Tax=Janthinobacterium kumbetense TaxID=2950280 RepID=A0ABT0WV85_9BURK|nr:MULTISPECIES: efflux RND transporter permease subunit [Janthinobacterium]MCM2567242.1 efflux RND transporter permease subunit [Janthinobacterium kumbetense]MDN2677164.1 efflux RND transporter permease subunit [Janthinobacterium sp. SUN033]MDN2702150.1 efflux RND transporter permease subunit [Janthinobacterium sp. SUN100]MDO8037835.1 efflux RND transporter permease subunit [Janthinobacterium sp. SUN137]MDO8072469.1 efflux RND transporter permease subunit [Janthinobacterium sp. SUN176]